MSTLAHPPQTLLASYGLAFRGLRWVTVDSGFSGAVVWRGDDGNQPRVALKRWPPETTAERIREIHTWLAQARPLTFVPHVLHTIDGNSIATAFDQLFDATSWLPGSPCQRATQREVEVACEAVAQLHAHWRPVKYGRLPGLQNRLRVLSDWLQAPLLHVVSPLPSEGIGPLIGRADAAVRRQASSALAALQPWAQLTRPLRPCIRDLRGEHVLFTGSSVTGIVDYGAMGVDHPAVDLARLLGDLTASDTDLFMNGLAAYCRAGGQLDVPDQVVRALDRSGAVCSLIGWLVRFSRGQGLELNTQRVVARLEQLITRVEGFDPSEAV